MSAQHEWVIWTIVVIWVVFLFLIITFPARAHDPARPDLDRWFDKLHSDKGPCCSASDGKAVSDVDWDSRDGHYRVRLDGAWLDVPDGAVITEPNLDGHTVVWPMRYLGVTTIRCFMPGTMT